MIFIKNGRIFVPANMIKDRYTKQRLGMHWHKQQRCWTTYAGKPVVERINTEFGTSLVVPIERPEQVNFPFKTKPRDYQLEALGRGLGKPAFAYLLDPGLGKTKVLIDEVQILASQGRLDSVIVTCPLNAMGVWAEEIQKHGYADRWSISVWQRPDISVNNGSALRWAIINKDALVSPTKRGEMRKLSEGYKWAERFMQTSGILMSAIDESTDIAGHDSNRTDAVFHLRKYTNYRRELNGTFIADKPLDCYSQLLYLDPDIVFDWSFYAYRSHFCHMGGYEVRGRPVQVLGYRNLDELSAMINSVSYKARQEDVEDLPDRVYLTKEVTLNPKTKKAYNAAIKEVYVALDESGITTEQAMTKCVKLRQITGGSVINDDGSVTVVGREKIDEVMESVKQIGDHKFLVWCQFTHEINAVSLALEKVRVSHGVYDGRANGRDRDEMVKSFEHENLQALIIQNDAGYRALTLNAASYVLIYSNPEKLDIRVQLEKRSHRIGQKKNVIYIDFIVPGSIDTAIRKSHEFKKDVADYVMGYGEESKALKSVVRRVLRPLA